MRGRPEGTWRGALFDLDGVLVDSRRPIAGCLNHALRVHGFEPLPEVELHGFIGPPLLEVFEVLVTGQGGDPALAGACCEAYRERYARVSLEETKLVDGIPDALDALASRLPIAVATSKPVEFAGPILETLGVASRFRAIVGPPLDVHAEEKSVTVGRALLRLGLRAGPEVALVGDRHHDVSAGRAHGLTTIGVAWGIGSRDELESAGVDRWVETPTELAEILG